ncbi:hypothetical protein PHET_08947 [Paragonimus heterotremus]|uniref:Uncharacterized protein n=1 Tax=Paragonimus heterotremus TaxID=100268 RepID=A0A8J4WEM2_9TREM|nr:hypothetical protein PHET_08947 [Paragonimus heterotremus]
MERKLRQLTEASQNVQSELERYHIRYECEEYKAQRDREEAQQIKFPAVRDLINTHLELQLLTRQEKIEAKHLTIAKTKYEQHKRLWARVRRSS